MALFEIEDTVQEAEDFLTQRGIDPEQASALGATIANGVLTFEYRDNGDVVKKKLRKLPKEKFWQMPAGVPALLWNVDALREAAQNGKPVVITEGELDAIAAIQCGYPWAVSVPDGAPPADAKQDESDGLDGKFKFIQRDIASIRKVKRFILATDADAPGRRLRDELSRRFGAGRCSFVEYPEGCKDLNDVLMKHGSNAVSAVITQAKPYPVTGIYQFNDYPDQELYTFNTGWDVLDNHLKLFFKEFMVVTGYPGHGKSTWTMQLLLQMARLHGFRSAIFTSEMHVKPILWDMMRAMDGDCLPEHATRDSEAWINDHFYFLDNDPKGGEDQDFYLDWVLSTAQDCIDRHGVRVLLIDPWNEIEHVREKHESLTEYTGRAIKELKRFAKRHGIIVIVVAHPTKPQKKKNDGGIEMPTLYDISDSAHWFNKCDHGIVVHKIVDAPMHTRIQILKSRFIQAGEAPGMVKLKRDIVSGKYVPFVDLTGGSHE